MKPDVVVDKAIIIRYAARSDNRLPLINKICFIKVLKKINLVVHLTQF